ncbi:MAG: HD domain-containing protein [Thermotaleaceae bacterium]
MKRNHDAETERIFCKHNLQHSIDVARVAYILSLERELQLSKEVIYATGLLHDIGRWEEYANGISHAEASAVLSEKILVDSGFDSAEREMILDAIKNHRKNGKRETPLSVVIYESDKISRLCLECEEIGDCNRFCSGEKPTLMY